MSGRGMGSRGIFYQGVDNPLELQREMRERATGDSGTFGSAGDPVAAQTPMVQNSMADKLRRLVGRAEEGVGAAGMQGEIDLSSHLDPTLSYEENKALLREKFGLEFRTEERERHRRMADAVEAANLDRARNQVIDYCEAIHNQTDLDGPTELNGALDGLAPEFDGTIDVDGRQTDAETILDNVQSIADEMGVDVVEDAIERCRSDIERVREVQAPDELIEFVQDRVEEITGVQPQTVPAAMDAVEREIEDLEREVQQAGAAARDELLGRLSNALGTRLRDFDEAERAIRDRIEEAREQAVDTGTVAVVRRGDDFQVEIDNDPDGTFDDHLDRIGRRVREELLLEELADPDRQHVGTVQAEAGRLTEIDLSLGIEKLGARGDGEPLSQPPTSEAQEIAEEAIAFLEGPDAP